MDDSNTTPNTRIFLLIGLASLALLLGFVFRDSLNFAALSENRERLIDFRNGNYALSAIVFIAFYCVLVAFSLPGATIATLTGGFLFGVFPGALFNVIAATLGASALFAAARWGLGDWLSARLDASSGKISSFKRGIDENQWSMLFIIRLMPILPFFVANLLPALFGVSFTRFVISTFFGIMPGAVVYTSLGAGLSSVFEKGETPNLSLIFELHILLPLLGLSALAFLPVLLKLRTKG